MRQLVIALLPALLLTGAACAADDDGAGGAAGGSGGSAAGGAGGSASGGAGGSAAGGAGGTAAGGAGGSAAGGAGGSAAGGAGGSAAGGAGGSAAGGAGGSAAGGAGGSAPGPLGGDRPVTLFVPSSYRAGTPMPLVILLHGYGASGALQEAYFGLGPLAEARGFLYAHPDGTVDAQGRRFWNATDACCDFYGAGVDDAGWLTALIDEIGARWDVDPKRVFLVGHSNGGFFSHRMACDHADKVAAIASLAGASFADPARCAPSEPVSVLQIHGDHDGTVLFEGGSFGSAYPGAVATVEGWAAADGCDATARDGAPVDLATRADAYVATSTPLPGAEAAVKIWDAGCSPGGGAELWTIVGGDHIPALSPGFGGAVIDFLFAHPKP